MMTADLRAFHPQDTEDQAVLRPLARARSMSRYERARIAARALTTRVRADRLNSRSLPHTADAPADPRPSLPGRAGRTYDRDREPATVVAAVDQSRRTLEAAAAEMAARLQAGSRQPAAGSRERGAARQSRPQPATATAPPPLPRACPARTGRDQIHRRRRMTTTPSPDPRIEAIAARLREATQERAEARARHRAIGSDAC